MRWDHIELKWSEMASRALGESGEPSRTTPATGDPGSRADAVAGTRPVPDPGMPAPRRKAELAIT